MWPSTHRRNPARILARAACISLRPMPFPPKPFIDIEAMRFGGCFVEGAERQRPGGRLFPSGDQDFFASVELNFSDSESERSLGRRTSASVSPWSGAMTASHSPGFVRSPSAALRSSRLRATEMTHDMASSCPRLRTGSTAGARGLPRKLDRVDSPLRHHKRILGDYFSLRQCRATGALVPDDEAIGRCAYLAIPGLAGFPLQLHGHVSPLPGVLRRPAGDDIRNRRTEMPRRSRAIARHARDASF